MLLKPIIKPRPAIAEKWYDAYSALDAFNHCKVAGGKHRREHRIKLYDNPNFPLFTGIMYSIYASIYHTIQHFSQHHKSC